MNPRVLPGADNSRWQVTPHLLALCVIILYEVLQQVHALFGLDFINFDEILLEESRILCWELQTAALTFPWEDASLKTAQVGEPGLGNAISVSAC